MIRYHRHWPSRHAAFHNEFKRFFDAAESDGATPAAAQWTPRVDIKEEADRFVIYADLPGIDPQDIELQMDKGILSIKGERKSESATETERFSRVERRYGNFHRRFALPDSADADGIAATGNNGVLEISIPKKPETAARRIQVGSPTVQ